MLVNNLYLNLVIKISYIVNYAIIQYFFLRVLQYPIGIFNSLFLFQCFHMMEERYETEQNIVWFRVKTKFC